MTWKTDGKIGINTTAPAKLLHLYTGAASAGEQLLYLENAAAGGEAAMAFKNDGRYYTMGLWGSQSDAFHHNREAT